MPENNWSTMPATVDGSGKSLTLKSLLRSLLALAVCVLWSSPPDAGAADLPSSHRVKGWYLSGLSKDYYITGVEHGVKHDGQPVASLKYREPNHAAKPFDEHGFGTVMQNIDARKFVGKRVRFSGLLKADNVSEGAGLWLRIDDLRGSLAFDNMQDERRLSGTTEFKPCSIVLDVPPQASSIAFGVLLEGKGEVQISGLKFEEVGPDVSVTGSGSLPLEPMNLSFQDDI